MNRFATFKEILAAETQAVSPGLFLLNLALAAALSVLLRLVYIRFGRSLSNRRDFSSAFPLVAVTTALVIGIVKSSLALSLGMVGALSIVRFRAAIKEPEELSYLFLSLAIGVGMGAEQRVVTVAACLFIFALVALGSLFRGAPGGAPCVLILSVPGDGRALLAGIEPLLEAHARASRFRRMEEREGGVEIAWSLEPKGLPDLVALRDAVRSLEPKATVSLLDGAAGL